MNYDMIVRILLSLRTSTPGTHSSQTASRAKWLVFLDGTYVLGYLARQCARVILLETEFIEDKNGNSQCRLRFMADAFYARDPTARMQQGRKPLLNSAREACVNIRILPYGLPKCRNYKYGCYRHEPLHHSSSAFLSILKVFLAQSIIMYTSSLLSSLALASSVLANYEVKWDYSGPSFFDNFEFINVSTCCQFEVTRTKTT